MMALGGYLIIVGVMALFFAIAITPFSDIYPDKRGRLEPDWLDDLREYAAVTALLAGGGLLVTGLIFFCVAAVAALIA